MASREEVYKALDTERDYQVSLAEKVSGVDSGEHKHSIEEFVIYMEDYLTELKHQMSRTWTPTGKADEAPPALNTLRKITALGVACMEQHGALKRSW